MATTEASEVSLTIDTQLLVCGGIAILTACGSTTFQRMSGKGRPSASAASNWPLGMLSMPARSTSAVKAASTTLKATLADMKDDSRMPRKGRA